MRKVTSYLVLFMAANILSIAAIAQSVTISGNVRNSTTKEGAGAVSVTIKGAETGTFTDDKGNFKISVKSLPVTLLISSVGYELQEVTVNKAGQMAQVEFKPTSSLGQEVVVSASRVPQKILESPVTVERISAAAIRTSPVANFYDIISTIKGVDVTTSSLTFVTPTTRGFNSSGNTRFNQLVDGKDNQAPGLNFSVGAIVGLSELDVDNLELLSGASSALYGSGGMNGTLLMTSKNPFKYQGFSFTVKTGVMHTDHAQRDASGYHNWNMRWARKESEKFAWKVNAELIQAKDWLGFDYRDYRRSANRGTVVAGTRASDPNYDGINVYGDETTIDIRAAVLNTIGASAAPFLKNFIDTLNGGRGINVSRTGYTEKEVTNPNTVNFKLGTSLHYKIAPFTEAIFAAYWGTGNTIYTGSERYSLKGFKMGQYKLELNNRYWMVRAYTTQENAGESYNTTVATRLLNEAWYPSGGATGWFATYAQNYLAQRLNGVKDSAAHAAARSVVDVNRVQPNTARFKAIFDSVRARPISQGGALLLDKSDLYVIDGSYNFSHLKNKTAGIELMVGGNYKQYVLNSEGTLFADSANRIKIAEFGGFIQAGRRINLRGKRTKTANLMWNDVVLTASGRYDRNENFEGRFTPRVTAVIKYGANTNFRFSYQSAYRFPSNQQQFINLVVGSNVRLIGGDPSFRTFFNFAGKQLYDFESLRRNIIAPYTPVDLKPESLTSFEGGWKGLIFKGKLLVDLYGYVGKYRDFLGRRVFVQNLTSSNIVLADTAAGYRYSIPVNSPDKVKTYGYGISLDYRLPWNFTIGGNISSDNLKETASGFIADFNSPKYKGNVTFGNIGFGPGKRLAFNGTYRFQQGFRYNADFATGDLPAVQTVDAQFSYKLPKTKSILKLGATNLLNQYYYNAIGNSYIGGVYYVSFGYNVY